MTDKLKCCFCGAELNDYPDKTTGARMAVCRNPKCKYDGWHFPIEIIQQIIAGKKAQDAIQKIKDIVYPALDREFYSELRDDMLYIGRIIVSVEKQEK